MTISSLNIALSGLKAAQKALDVTSNNISNASTPGYTRKILPQEAIVTADGTSLGVRIQEIIRNVDMSLMKSTLEQQSRVAELDTRQKFLDRISDFHGASDAERAISADISRLAEQFTILSSTPSDPLVIDQVINQAIATSSKINDFSDLVLQMSNDAQEDISLAVNDINKLLESIADFNIQISQQAGLGQSSAGLQDQRDLALNELSKLIDISFFERENNQITVMTNRGQVLADGNPRTLSFAPTRVLPGSFYPGGGSAGVFLDGTPPVDITADNLGGSIGELITLRDETMPQYMAQIDELAQKLASRFDSQGLTLFTDRNGNVPANVAPPGPVGYVGFSAEMQVNDAIINNPDLIREGTTGASVLAGSNEVIRKIVEFTFGRYEYEEATGTTDISVGTIFGATGLTGQTQVPGSVDITQINPLDSHPDIIPGTQFFVDAGGGPLAVTINAGDTATDLVNNINLLIGPGTARLNTLGQLVFESTNNITLANASLGAAGIAALGHSFGTFNVTNPDFTIQVGSENPITINISGTDTATDLLNTLNAIPNITASLNGAGGLQITPTNGGDLILTDGFNQPLAAMGVTTASVEHTPFRQLNLGPNGTVNTELLATTSLEDFAQSIVSFQGEALADTTRKQANETNFFNTLTQRQMDQSGVDLDQEVGELIRIQTAYTSAARMITASEEMMDALFAAIR